MSGSISYASPRSDPDNPVKAADPLSPPQHPPPHNFTRRRFVQGAAISAVGLGLYSAEFARHAVEYSHHTIAIRDLPPAFHGFRITQISDIHLDEYTEPIFLRHTIARVNALNPDLVLITGDFITHGPPRNMAESSIYTCAGIIRGLTCPQRFSVLGNHDVTSGAEFVTSVLREHGTPVLINQYLPVERDGQRLWIAGVEDPATSHPDLDLAIPESPDGPVILMAHAPDYADYVRRSPRGQHVDFMLSGHSHGGQVRLPLIGSLMLPPMGKRYVMGHYKFERLQLYTNRGLGAVGLPFRLNCPPEISSFTLQPA